MSDPESDVYRHVDEHRCGSDQHRGRKGNTAAGNGAALTMNSVRPLPAAISVTGLALQPVWDNRGAGEFRRQMTRGSISCPFIVPVTTAA